MRIAAFALAFDVAETLPAMIDNVGPHVERIYIAYSEYPWIYNPEARAAFRNPTDLSIIEACACRDKVTVIHGTWDSDEDQRNACVERAVGDGFDVLLVQDADEFVAPEDFPALLAEIQTCPETDLFRIHWVNFWKTTAYALVNAAGSVDTGTPEYAINLRRGIRFTDRRMTNAQTERVLPQRCFHLAYIGSDERIYRKINTWSHSHEFDAARWYRQKWLRWNPAVRYLHPVKPTAWPRAVPYDGPVPAVLRDWPGNNNMRYRESPVEAISRFCRDVGTPARLRFEKLLRSVKRRLQ